MHKRTRTRRPTERGHAGGDDRSKHTNKAQTRLNKLFGRRVAPRGTTQTRGAKRHTGGSQARGRATTVRDARASRVTHSTLALGGCICRARVLLFPLPRAALPPGGARVRVRCYASGSSRVGKRGAPGRSRALVGWRGSRAWPLGVLGIAVSVQVLSDSQIRCVPLWRPNRGALVALSAVQGAKRGGR